MQTFIDASYGFDGLGAYFAENGLSRPLLVRGNSARTFPVTRYMEEQCNEGRLETTVFSDYTPNPLYGEAVRGTEAFWENKCDCILAVGGGSAMDIAKCIKLFSCMEPGSDYLTGIFPKRGPKLIVQPTTAGTGSEATRFAVLYRDGEKQSIFSELCLPDAVIWDASCLKTLPEYTRKASVLDALCHAVESFWSVRSTEESKGYSRAAIKGILSAWDLYLRNDDRGNRAMLEAANLAGKAINLAQTTAGHAMCYKLTSLYGLAHGHAAALCTAGLWALMADDCAAHCADKRGPAYLKSVLAGLSRLFGVEDIRAGPAVFQGLLESLELESLTLRNEAELDCLVSSVNQVRLKNNPIHLQDKDIRRLYREILNA